MRHLTVMEYGHFLGCQGERLQVKGNDGLIAETPLSRLRSVTIAKRGVSFSSNLLLECASRGIRFFIADWRGRNVVALSGTHQHAVSALRRAQFEFIETPQARSVAAQMQFGKVRNQRAVLLYFSKYSRLKSSDSVRLLATAADKIAECSRALSSIDFSRRDSWREEILGYEGAAASIYWRALAAAQLVPDSFVERQGRGATEVTNQLLNYGYSLLTTYVWSALDNAGFELYCGILHAQRPGKPSLVLDFMEEYRPWVVDRCVIKLRQQLKNKCRMDTSLKRKLTEDIQYTMSKPYAYNGKRLRLESILQRQAYRLGGVMVENKTYRPYRFRW